MATARPSRTTWTKFAPGKAASSKRARGQPVEYLVVENGGHVGNAWRWSERLRVYRAVEDFLAGCLGGRSGGFDLYQAPGWVM